MKTLHMDAGELGLSFGQCKRLADAAAERLLGGAMLLSFYDRDRDLESPGGVSECHQGCATPGWQDYAENRGGTLMVDFERGRHVFCYRPLED
jgi:hypothetical protein